MMTALRSSASSPRSLASLQRAAARNLNAAPLLNTSTRLRNPVSSRRSPGTNQAWMSHLATWSATTIPAASANQGHALGIYPGLARSVQVRFAARAKAPLAHVLAVMPAAVALRVRARRHLDALPARGAGRALRGSQHHELQPLAEAREQLVVLAVGVEIHLGLERRADLPGVAQLLDLLAHRIAQLAQPRPALEQPPGAGHPA